MINFHMIWRFKRWFLVQAQPSTCSVISSCSSIFPLVESVLQFLVPINGKISPLTIWFYKHVRKCKAGSNLKCEACFQISQILALFLIFFFVNFYFSVYLPPLLDTIKRAKTFIDCANTKRAKLSNLLNSIPSPPRKKKKKLLNIFFIIS